MKFTMSGATLALLITTAGVGLAAENSKPSDTPAFCQRDPRAGFEGDGSNYCAPTSISNGLVLLAGGGFPNLMADSGDDGQIELIKELAAEMGTDPRQGTNPDQILTGLQQFVTHKGYHFKRLEYAGWRPLGASNKRFKVAAKPDLRWLRSAAADPECVEVFNVGWYRDDGESYTRQSGHWVTAVGVGDGPGGNSLLVHNPWLPSEQQYDKTEVELTALDEDFVLTGEDQSKSLAGYYEVDGAGVPHGKTISPVLDCAIVFSLRP